MGPRGDPGRRRGVGGRGSAPLNRTVLVTGGAGFIGASLVRHLAERGDRVRVLDDFSIGHRAYLQGVEHELIEGSLADLETVAEATADVDAIVHLAARADIVESIRDPMQFFDANVAQTVNLLEAARRAGTRRFVLASTNAALGSAAPPLDESIVPRPISPYGASKLAGEAFCSAYAGAYGMCATSLRFSNVYGPFNLHKKSVVAAWVRATIEGRSILINGDGSQTRDYIFAGDLAEAIGRVLNADPVVVAGEVYHLGTGVETSLNLLADALREATGRPLAIEHGPPRTGDVARNVSRVDKIESAVGFRAAMPLVDGLRRTSDWFARAQAEPTLASITPHGSSGSD